MQSSKQRSGQSLWSAGRGFTSVDPERQREVIGYVRAAGSESAPASRGQSERAARVPRLDWMRVQADRDSNSFEGSSSRRIR